MAMVPSLQRLQRLFARRAANGGINDSRVAATQLPKIDSYGLPSPISHPETQLNIAGSSKVPSHEVQQANREVCHRKLQIAESMNLRAEFTNGSYPCESALMMNAFNVGLSSCRHSEQWSPRLTSSWSFFGRPSDWHRCASD